VRRFETAGLSGITSAEFSHAPPTYNEMAMAPSVDSICQCLVHVPSKCDTTARVAYTRQCHHVGMAQQDRLGFLPVPCKT
jgi:hypothetical protein